MGTERGAKGRLCPASSGEHGAGFQLPVPESEVCQSRPELSAHPQAAFTITHFYFYIRDEVLGPMVMCVGTFLPFQTTYYIDGHHFIERELQRQGIRFRKDDNAFLCATDPKALRMAADKLDANTIRKRLDY
jgi:hypothetical protein